jgi:hypothetical protein
MMIYPLCKMLKKQFPYFLLVFICSCSEFGLPFWIETLHPGEDVLCSGSSRVIIGEPKWPGGGVPDIIFWTRININDETSQLYATLEAMEGESNYSQSKLVGKRLTKHDTFQFAGRTWQIRELGSHGIYVKQVGNLRNHQLCRDGFVFMQQISPPTTLKRHPYELWEEFMQDNRSTN